MSIRLFSPTRVEVHDSSSQTMASTTNGFGYKVLVPEKVSADGLALLRKNFLVDEKKGLSAKELQDTIGDYDALIVRSETKVTAELLSFAKKLRVVARAGVGVDNVGWSSCLSLLRNS